MANPSLFLIECITNLHVGSGDANYGTIDKLVQRDHVTGAPVINASSLKGALREFFEKSNLKDKVSYIFGSDDKDHPDAGKFIFTDANMLSIPVRCSFQQFAHAISRTDLEMINRKINLLTGAANFFNIPEEENIFCSESRETPDKILAEDYEIPVSGSDIQVGHINKALHNLAILDDDKYKSLFKRLPVIARNSLNNGISENLWYEEVVPHHSLFITSIIYTEDKKEIINQFEQELQKSVIQIGGNSTIGYGLCKLSIIN